MLYEILGRPLLKIILIGVIIFAILLFNLNNNYEQKAYKVTINNDEVFLKYHETYRRVIIPNLMDARSGNYGFYKEEPVNQISYSDQFILNVEKYSVFYTYDKTHVKGQASWYFSDDYIYTKEKLDKTRLVIKRKGNIIYDDIYIEDITKYISGPGRYFFQVYINQNDNFYTSLNMHMSFNVIIGGGNHEE